MSKINELRAQRAKTWEQTKAFLDSHRSDKGVLSVEDTATYEKMEQEIVDLGREIERQERLDAFERELNTPVNTPITQKPDTAKVDTKTGRASDTYKKAFWAQARTKGGMMTAEIRNALQEGVDSEGGYLVPDEFEQTLVQSLEAENVVRSLAHVITTASGSHKIPIVATKGTAAWVDEEGSYKWAVMDTSVTATSSTGYDADFGIGWRKLSDTADKYTGTGTNTLTVYAAAVDSYAVFKCCAQDTDSASASYNTKFFDVATFIDNSDPLQIIVTSTGGDVFKNGQGTTVLTAVCYQAGSEVDAAGNGSYTWTKYNKDGVVDTSWGTNGSKTGKTLSVSSADVDTKATFMVVVAL